MKRWGPATLLVLLVAAPPISAATLLEVLAAQTPPAAEPSAPLTLPPADPTDPLAQRLVPEAMTSNRAAPPDGETSAPFARLLERFSEPGPLDPALLTAGLAEYYTDIGAAGTDFDAFEENATVMYTYPIGDSNGDGTEDLLLNLYCMDLDACLPLEGSGFPPAVLNTADRDGCKPPYWTWGRGGRFYPVPNRLYALDGENGSVLWARNQSVRDWNLTRDPASFAAHHLNTLCPFEFVLGTVPTADGGRDILVYSYMIAPRPTGGLNYPVGNGCFLSRESVPPEIWAATLGRVGEPDTAVDCVYIEHRIFLLNHTTGKPMWNHSKEGWFARYSDTRRLVMRANNWTIHPSLMVPTRFQSSLLPAAVNASLFLDYVGWFSVSEYIPPTLTPGSSFAWKTVDIFDPYNWQYHLDPRNGRQIWPGAVATFSPQAGRSIVPMSMPRGTLEATTDTPTGESNYWNGAPCCFDLTGDGVSDSVYATMEWSPTPMYNTDGPYNLSARIVAFDGATGTLLWSQLVEPGTQRFLREEHPQEFTCWLQSCHAFNVFFDFIGDANGDGISDVLVHRIYFQEHFRRVFAVLDGLTGKELWNRSSPRNLGTLVLGDSDGDGGNDLLTYEWTDWEFPIPTVYHANNVSVLPLTVVSGRTGTNLWAAQTRTFQAPVDLGWMFANFATSGLPDIDGDGVGDVPTDDPLLLPDIEVVHRVAYLSGRTGEPIRSFTSVGTFCFVSYAGDLDANGRDEFAVLNGDLIDLWLTFYADNGTALWSRRVLSPRIADYLQAVPLLRLQSLHDENGTVAQTALTFHLVVTTGGFNPGQFRFPELLSLLPNGTVGWSLPQAPHEVQAGWLLGATTGTQAFIRLAEEAARNRDLGDRVAHAWTPYLPFGIAYVGTLAAAFPVAVLQPWRRRPPV